MGLDFECFGSSLDKLWIAQDVINGSIFIAIYELIRTFGGWLIIRSLSLRISEYRIGKQLFRAKNVESLNFVKRQSDICSSATKKIAPLSFWNSRNTTGHPIFAVGTIKNPSSVISIKVVKPHGSFANMSRMEDTPSLKGFMFWSISRRDFETLTPLGNSQY